MKQEQSNEKYIYSAPCLPLKVLKMRCMPFCMIHSIFTPVLWTCLKTAFKRLFWNLHECFIVWKDSVDKPWLLSFSPYRRAIQRATEPVDFTKQGIASHISPWLSPRVVISLSAYRGHTRQIQRQYEHISNNIMLDEVRTNCEKNYYADDKRATI